MTKAICNSLESDGIRCWYAPRDTVGTYAGSIASAIGNCRVFVLVLNRESSLSQDVLNEINLAVERTRREEDLAILPFQISSDRIGEDARYYLGRIHWIDAVDPPLEARITELKQRIVAILRKSSSSGRVVPTRRKELESSRILPNRHFVCRTRELEQLRESLADYNKIFLQGMGGIGKSELAKAYAIGDPTRYDTVILATYQTGLRDLLICDPGFRCDSLPRGCDEDGRLESDDAYFHRKLEWLQNVADRRTLLIIDNFDTQYDEDLEDFLRGPYAVILTTRNDFEDLGLPVLRVEEMDQQEQLELFSHYYRRCVPEKDRHAVVRILEQVNGHTLAIELIAKYMCHRHIQPDKMLDILRQRGIEAMAEGTVSRGFGRAQSGAACIRQLFDLYALTENERQILTDLALVPLSGVEVSVFGELCQLEDLTDLDELIRKSWIRYDVSEDIVWLHPLIREVVWKECLPDLKPCSVMLGNLTERLKGLWGASFEDKLRYGALGKSVYECFPQIDGDFVDTYIAIAFGMTLLEQYDLSDELNKACLRKHMEMYGEKSSMVAEAYYHLGDNELHRNDVRAAVGYLSKAIDILEEVDPDSPRLAYMIKFLCWTRLGWLDDHEETERLLHKSNKILSAQVPIDMSQMASQQSAYATLYYLMGQYERGLSYAEKSYEIFNGMYGDLHGDTLAPMGIKSRILSRIGREGESVRLAKCVIDIQIQLNGNGHQKVLNRYEALAEIYENLGDIPQARRTLRKILDLLAVKKDNTSLFYRRIQGKYEKLNINGGA